MSGSVELPVASGAAGGARHGEELLSEFLMERLRKQYDWNVGLNGRASMLLALTGIAFTLLLGSEFAIGEFGDSEFTLELAARVIGLALLMVGATVLLRAVRRRPEAVWGAADLASFIARCRGASGEQVSTALVNRLRDGTARNEEVLAGKSREIEVGTILTLVGLITAALGRLQLEGVPILLIVVIAGLLVVLYQSTTLFESAGRNQPEG